MTAFYNEIDEFAAAWLRNLIAGNHIAPGEVDTRSIKDVSPDDLVGFNQCHFFAGIGVWSYAARRAGLTDDRSFWTGSCPCQPFSAAGKGGGFDDERHLWPDFFRLIRKCRPDKVYGEQVASRDGLAWLDLVSTDMEGAGYAVGAVDLCAAGVGAPHIRQRLWWYAKRMADAELPAQPRQRSLSGEAVRIEDATRSAGDGMAGGLDRDASVSRLLQERQPSAGSGVADASGQRLPQQLSVGGAPPEARGALTRETVERICTPNSGMADTYGEGRDRRAGLCGGGTTEHRGVLAPDDRSLCAGQPGPVNGLWRDADWLFCRDGKWRPVEPGTFPLAHGAPARVGRLRGYGNAINAEAAEIFMRCCP